MNLSKFLLIICGTSIVAFLVTIAVYLGAFDKIEVLETGKNEIQVIQTFHRGAYHKIVPSIKRVEEWAQANNIDCKTTFGRFMDNPKTTAEENLRSYVGCVINSKPKEKIPDQFEYMQYNFNKYVSVEFSGSPAIGPFKVYPKANDYISKKNLNWNKEAFEIYKSKSENDIHTTYLFPILTNKNESI